MIWLDTGEAQYYRADSAKPYLDAKRPIYRAVEDVGDLRITGRGEVANLAVTIANGGLAERFAVPPERAVLRRGLDAIFAGRIAEVSVSASQVTLTIES